MSNLPESFLAVMQDMLQEEYPAFLQGYDNHRQYGLRVNTDKVTTEQFERIAPFHLTKIPWIPNGYYYEEEDQPARHPFYAAGLYYLQEPSAMTPASRLPVVPGERVLDLCAAPGGKATALGANLQGQGVLVANDINQARAKALLRNLELFGLPNVFITNEPPHRMAEAFPEYFDKIMVDAPCSGEGMFRKNPAVIDAWKEKGPDYFSKLQKDIILYAFDMLKPGGMMFYSTCTFSPLENEGVITHLLRERKDADILAMEDYEGFSPGLTSFRDEIFDERCRFTRRVFPHKMPGEGHYLALIQKNTSGLSPLAGDLETEGSLLEEILEKREKKSKKNKKKELRKKGQGKQGPSKDEKVLLEDFLERIVCEELKEEILSHLEIRADKAYYVPNPDFAGKGLHFLRNGVYLGDIKKNRFEPSQPCALMLREEKIKRSVNFTQTDDRIQQYLHGESFDIEDLLQKDQENRGNGWVLLTVDHYPLGFGKLVGSTLKNKYPVGWRI